MGKLPQDELYADLFCKAFRAVQSMDTDYFRNYIDFIAPMPAAFSLVELRAQYVGRIPNQQARCAVAAEIYRIVVGERPHYFSRLIDLKWLSDPSVQTAALIVYIVNEVRLGADLRSVDLSRASAASPEEIAQFSDNVRDVNILCLRGCKPLDSTVALISNRCRYLREIDLTGCSLLSDASCDAIGSTCKELQRLSLESCLKISDAGVNDIARNCMALTALNLKKCQLVTDESLTAIGEACQHLRELTLGWMQQITDRGVYTFASYASVKSMRTLDVSACRKIGDDGVIGIAERLTNLTDLNLFYCNKITDRGAISVTHNLFKLTSLSLADLYQITDHSLHFDRDGDGRPVVDANMLNDIRKLDLTDCNRLTDFGLASVVTRCTGITSLTLAGCVGLTDLCLRMIRVNPVKELVASRQAGVSSNSVDIIRPSDKSQPHSRAAPKHGSPPTPRTWERFGKLRELNISYCATFTDKGIGYIAGTCNALTGIDISGCTRLTDEAIRLLSASCPCISSMKMAYCHGMTDASLHHMAQGLWIEILDASHCARISDEGIIVLVGRCNGIRCLKLAWCRKITDRAMACLASECKHMQLLDVSAIREEQITGKALTLVCKANPTVDIVRDSHLAASHRTAPSVPEV